MSPDIRPEKLSYAGEITLTADSGISSPVVGNSFSRRTFLKGLAGAGIAALSLDKVANASHTPGIENQADSDMDAIGRSLENIFEDVDRPFFSELQERLGSGLHGEFFDIKLEKKQNMRSYTYFPEGKTTPRPPYRFAYFEQYGPSDDVSGNPFLVRYAETRLQVCSDGTLSQPIDGGVQFQIADVKELVASYFKTPDLVEGSDWVEEYGQEVATVYQWYRGPLGLRVIGGKTDGLLILQHGIDYPINAPFSGNSKLHLV